MSKKSKQTLRLVLNGGSGRMGEALQALIAADKTLHLTKVVDQDEDFNRLSAKDVDVVVDFSSPQGFEQALKWCIRFKIPLVSGTTGLSSATLKKLKSESERLPILHSANMSAGVAALSVALESLKALHDWDFQIEEAHHNLKKDRPSGTALLLQDKLEKVLDRDLPAANSIRGGGIPGIHQVWAMGPDEVLLLQHTAFNRKVFAQGALYAARWLFDKGAPGLYDLSDLYKRSK